MCFFVRTSQAAVFRLIDGQIQWHYVLALKVTHWWSLSCTAEISTCLGGSWVCCTNGRIKLKQCQVQWETVPLVSFLCSEARYFPFITPSQAPNPPYFWQFLEQLDVKTDNSAGGSYASISTSLGGTNCFTVFWFETALCSQIRQTRVKTSTRWWTPSARVETDLM